MKSDFVLDASSLVEALGASDPDRGLLRRLLTGNACAPDIIYLEALNSVRKWVLHGEMSKRTADAVVKNILDYPLVTSLHRPLVSRAWELHHAITPYDASYVALAEGIGVPLVTCGRKASRQQRSHGQHRALSHVVVLTSRVRPSGGVRGSRRR